MKILYLINFAGKGGTEKYVRDLVNAYHGKLAECFFAYNVGGPLVDFMNEKGVKSVQISMKSPYDISAAKKIASFCRDNAIDIIHTQFPRENYIAVLSKLFYKKVKLFNTSHLIINQGAVWKIINKLLSRHDEKVFSVCNFGKETLINNGVCASKIEVVFNGIPICDPYRSDKVRHEFGISDDTFVVSALTRYTSEKGLHFLVETISKLRGMTERKFVFLVAGDGEMFDEITQKIKDLGLSDVIIQLGYRNDAPDILACSDLFVNLSSTEALSFAILEALGQGVPVVATDVGGTRDIINPNNICGSLVEYSDAAAGANEILRYIEDAELCKSCSAAALENVRKNFDINIMLDTVYDRYKKSLKTEDTKDE
ncbi:MAG: glycosyltransferase [Ruminococcaceae bacterium]|nr:glycosyltransferase [Oscillospiraceae bacterium]